MGNTNPKVVKIGKGNTENLSNEEVRKMLQTQLKLQNKIYLSDRDYISVDEDRLKEFARKDGTSDLKYKAESADCDNFTRVFLGAVSKNVFKYGANNNREPAIGQVQGEIYKDGKPVKHSMVIYITKGKVKLFEPQNDKIYEIDPRNTYWLVQL